MEFKPRGTFAPVTGYRAGGPHGLAPGEWTDDTSMALALADSLASVGWDLADQARRYLAWWREGKYSVNGRCFDIGIATREALARIAAGASAATSGADDDGKSGNGSIMRLAPAVIHDLSLFPAALLTLADQAASSSYPTHRSSKCLSACRYLAVVLAALMSGRSREEVLSPEWPVLSELHAAKPLDPAILEVARGSYRRKEPPQIRGSGYVVDSLEAALWAFHEAPTFRDAVLAAVNLGDDADTTGAVCGQLAGAYFGADGIPSEWLEGLAKREWLEDAVRSLSRSEVASTPSPLQLADAGAAPPTTRCYWVVRGRLLAGAYPGDPDPKAHAARLEKLWGAGIRTFVSLMEEHETNNKGVPFAKYADDVAALAARTGEPASCVRFAIKDVSVTTPSVMVSILDFIDREVSAGRPVYVHCFGGIGRTGTVVGCWLLRRGLASREDVLQVIARLRQKDEQRASRPSPETEQQVSFMRTWSEPGGA